MDYARNDPSGKSTLFFQKGRYELLALGLIPFSLLFLAGTKAGLAASGTFILITLMLLWFFKNKIGGVTGDSLGALTELLEISLFIVGGIVCTNCEGGMQ